MKLKALNETKGWPILARIRTLNFSLSDAFSVDPLVNRQLRSRAIFRKDKTAEKPLLVYFHLGDEESPIGLASKFQTIYLYGFLNNPDHYQIRSRGSIRTMIPAEKDDFINRLTDRFLGRNIGDKLTYKLSEKEKLEAAKLLLSGYFYCFEPLDYVLYLYEKEKVLKY